MTEQAKRKLVIGYQDTPQGLDALELGGVLAEALDGRPTAATIPLFAMVLPWSKQLLSAADLEAALYLESDEPFKIATDRLGHLHPETRAIASHSPSGALFDLAAEEDAVAIVVGSSHRGTLGRVFAGTVGQALLHGAPCAVAVAPAGYAERADRRLRRIGVAVDGSDESGTALASAVALARRLRARLTVITVAEPEGYGYGFAGTVPAPLAQYKDLERNEQRRVLDRALDSVPEGVEAESKLLSGPAGRRLAEVSDEFDLLVLGSRGYGAVRSTAVGSVSRQLINAAKCPLLVLPRGAGDDPLGLAAEA